MRTFIFNKSIVALCSTLVLIGCTTAKHTEAEYNTFIRQADSLYMAGNYTDANISFANAFKCKEFIQENHLYNGACVAALAGDADNAFGRLNMRMKRNKDWYVDDPMRDNDLTALHTDARWEKYVAEMSARKERIEKDYDKPLREQLKNMVREDQAVRYEYIKAWQTGDSSAADSLLLPYRTATQSGVTQIAYNFSMPMLVTGVGGLPEIVPDGRVGVVCQPTVDGVYEGLQRLYADGELQRLKDNFVQERKRFSWATMCDKLLEVYEMAK